ncbi:hypothetical protein GCM10010136_02670 [Limoniibacter endophyticus]|uniref:Uncharacterized protein n=1 Tax=Limoniibacter endophyticus TaxID=1565040 RepID=A0A8J3GFC1_9HYPH|nr:hypothetical protein GCM10010136_02670 [Limoniibacter endophyticus]
MPAPVGLNKPDPTQHIAETILAGSCRAMLVTAKKRHERGILRVLVTYLEDVAALQRALPIFCKIDTGQTFFFPTKCPPNAGSTASLTPEFGVQAL